MANFYYNALLNACPARLYVAPDGSIFNASVGYMLHVKRLVMVQTPYVSGAFVDALIPALLADSFRKDFLFLSLDGFARVHISYCSYFDTREAADAYGLTIGVDGLYDFARRRLSLFG